MFELKIMHWNCFALTVQRNFELKHFLKRNKPDIFMIQELKLNNEQANLRLRYEGYSTYHKIRNTNSQFGGGVAILINEKISHTQILDLDVSLELIGLRLEIKKFTLDVFSYYNRPGDIISKSFFESYLINGNCSILLGDLNSKCAAVGCKKIDNSGKILEEVLENPEISLFNDDTPTYNCFSDHTYWEILDLAIGSSSLTGLISSFEVLEESMNSDHNVISLKLTINGSKPKEDTNVIQRFNFAKADWPLFYNLLQDFSNSLELSTIEEMDINSLNSFTTEKIIEVADKTIPKFKKSFRKSFPQEILKLIKERNIARRKVKKDKKKTPELKTEYNRLTNIVHQAIYNYESNKWNNFLNNLGPYPVKNSRFWKKINETKTAKQSSTIPNLLLNDTEFVTDEEKSNLFSSILKNTFSENDEESDFDSKHKSDVTDSVDNLDFSNSNFLPFNTIEIVKAIKKLKLNSAPGVDGIQNIFLKKLPYDFINKLLLKLINKSINSGIPDIWKKATVTMIPKKTIKSKNPSDYRPISLLSCLSKLTEKLVRNRLYHFLEEKKIFAKQQSGFRDNRGASDNLLFFTQKISETIEKGKKACAIFFDISKAFDKVWHKGVIFKLNQLQVPNYIIKYVKDFMKDRKFKVKINDFCGDYCPIKCGLAQGSAISPLLFLVYINDIPIANKKSICYSSLFADDLATFFIFKKSSKMINNMIKKYLENLVKWLFKWRLKMNAKKCCYTIFSKVGNKNCLFNKKINFNLLLNNELIPYNPNPLFLGVTFDEYLCFNTHADNLRARAENRLNIIKIVAHSSWHLTKTTLLNIYSALVSSIFTYSFFIVANISISNLEKIQIIQNNAIKLIFKLKKTFPNFQLLKISKILPLKLQLIKLGVKRIVKSIIKKNENTEILIREYLDSISSIRRSVGVNTPLCCFLSVIAIAILYLGLSQSNSDQD